MAKLVRVGFYRELTDDLDEQQGLPSITEVVSDSPQKHEEKATLYLRNGICLSARGGYVDDVLDPSSKVPLVPHLYTDGIFLWRLDLAHYVEKYHLRLPPDFVHHMASLNWCPPTREQVDLGALKL